MSQHPQLDTWVVVAESPWEAGANCVRSIHASRDEALTAVPSEFAAEWQDHMQLFAPDWPHVAPPSVLPAEWRAPATPEVGQRVRVEDNAVVSLIPPDERFPLPEHLRPDTPERDPLAKVKPYLLFHAKSDKPQSFPGDYLLVAKIEAESIDHALFLSKHSDTSWTTYPGVTAFTKSPRSTQVGDVIIDHDVPKQHVAEGWQPVGTAIVPRADVRRVDIPSPTASQYTRSHEAPGEKFRP